MKKNLPKPIVAVIMGSDSDLPMMKGASDILTTFAIPHIVSIVSAHRTPTRLYEFATKAHSRGIKLIIAGAGGSAHLPGMTAALSLCPVIGVPIETKSLKGVDSLYSILQMPKGVPVATVAINGAENAGLLAVQMLSINDPLLKKKLEVFKKKMSQDVLAIAKKLEQGGPENYLQELK